MNYQLAIVGGLTVLRSHLCTKAALGFSGLAVPPSFGFAFLVARTI